MIYRLKTYYTMWNITLNRGVELKEFQPRIANNQSYSVFMVSMDGSVALDTGGGNSVLLLL